MTKAELIKELRLTERVCRDRMDGRVLLDAADALEAADKRIAVLEKSYEWKAYAALEESIEGYKTRIAELEAQLPKEGEWETTDNRWGCGTYRCSVCNSYEDEKRNYCPNCGAKMDGKEGR